MLIGVKLCNTQDVSGNISSRPQQISRKDRQNAKATHSSDNSIHRFERDSSGVTGINAHHEADRNQNVCSDMQAVVRRGQRVNRNAFSSSAATVSIDAGE
jgi:hypothetical protein